MFYTYLWLRDDGTPYYTGKGTGRRAFRSGSPPKERIIIYPAESEADAFETEIALIWYYGRKDLGTGCLRNFTYGGEGASGCRQSELSRARKSAALIGKSCPSRGRRGKRPIEVGLKISASKMGHTVSQETRQKMAAAKTGKRGNNTGHHHSPTTRSKISLTKKGKPGTNTGRVFSAQARLNMSIAAKNRRIVIGVA
jgi:hypothetical protein